MRQPEFLVATDTVENQIALRGTLLDRDSQRELGPILDEALGRLRSGEPFHLDIHDCGECVSFNMKVLLQFCLQIVQLMPSTRITVGIEDGEPLHWHVLVVEFLTRHYNRSDAITVVYLPGPPLSW